MVQAPSALLWPRSKKAAGNGNGTSDNGESDGPRSRSRLAGSLTSNAVEDALMNVMSMSGSAPSSSNSDAMHKASPHFTSSPLTQRPLSPSATSDDGSDSSSVTAIDIPTKRSLPLPVNYPGGPSLGMSFLPPSQSQSRSFSSGSPSPSSSLSHRRRISSSLVFAETIHESSSEDDIDGQYHSGRQDRERERHSAFDTLPSGSPVSYSASTSFMNTSSPKYPSGLGISDSRRPHHQRRSLPPSTSTSPMQQQRLSPGPSSSSFSPSAIQKGFRRRSSGNHSPFTMGGGHNPLSTSPASPSPSLFSSSFVGSYEQSLLSGRMANKPSNASTPLPFTASIGVLGLGKNTPRALKCPDHVAIPFGAYFWDMDSSDKKGKGSPYVGTLDLTEHYLSLLEGRPSQALSAPLSESRGNEEASPALPKFPGYRIPPKGQIQVVIKNANQTAVKLFLVPYDLSDMPPGSKTFIRQKSYDTDPNAVNTSPELPPNATAKAKETLRYAIHLQFCALPSKDKERGRKKSSHATRRAPGLHHGHQQHPIHTHHHSHQPYHQEHHHYHNQLDSHRHVDEPRTLSPRRQRDVEPPARPDSPHAEPRIRRSRSDTANASHIFLYKTIRVAFTSRALDLSEKLKTVHEGPTGLQAAPSSKDPPAANADGPLDKDKYSSYTGPGEEWEEARRARIEADKAHEKHVVQMQKLQLQFDDPVPFDPNGESISASNASAARGSFVPEHASSAATYHHNGFTLLNTPPIDASVRSLEVPASSRGLSTSTGESTLLDAAYVPEPLVFQRSPVSKNVSLPSLTESGLAISRPGSRTRNHTTSPDKASFNPLPAKDALR